MPDKPTKPRRSLIVLGVFLGTLLLTSLWSIAADLHARAKQDTRYAAKLELAPVIRCRQTVVSIHA